MGLSAARAACAIVLAAILLGACGADDTRPGAESTGSDVADGADTELADRERFLAAVDGVTAVVADCFVSETSSDGRRYRTTVEVANESEVDRRVTVTIEATEGRGGTGPTIDVPAGMSDAWSVPSETETGDAEGDAACSDYITAISVTLDGPAPEQTP